VDVYSLVVRTTVPVVGLIENVLHYEAVSQSPLSPLQGSQSLIRAFVASILPTWRSCLAKDCAVTALSSKRVSAPGGPTVTEITAGAGTVVDTLGDSGISFDVALMPSTAPYRIGHIYFGGCPDGVLVHNEWTPDYVTVMQKLADELNKNISDPQGPGQEWSLTIWQKKLKLGHSVGLCILRDKPTALNKRLLPFP